jgi:hypothetical protein
MRSNALSRESEGGIGLILRQICPSGGPGGSVWTVESPELAPYR